MIGMARAGHGSSYYGETADDLMDPFREEFDLLNALCARRLQLEIEPAPGVKVTMLNEYDVASAIRLVVAGPRVRRRSVGGRAVQGAEETRGFQHQRSGHARHDRAALHRDRRRAARDPARGLHLPVLPASAFGAISEDELVLRRVGELEAAGIQLQARRAAMDGEWDTVLRLLRKAEKLGADNPWIAAVVIELRKLAERRDQALFSKASAYGSRRMQSRLAVRDRERGCDFDSPPAAPYLRRKSNQGKGDDKQAPSPPRT